VPRGQQRELVQRQRPAHHRRRDEGDPPDGSLLELIEQRTHGRAAFRPAERQRIVERRQHPRPGREDQRVVAHRVAAAQHDAQRGWVERRHAGLHQLGAEVLDDPPQRVPPRLTEPERLGDGHRPVDEIRFPRDERHAGSVTGQVVQRHHRLEGGDTAADDKHLGRRPRLGHGPTLRLPRAAVNGRTRRRWFQA
jgi:hypothetical protein